MITETAIRPEILAGKLAKAHNLEAPDLARQLEANPRLVELLWFIQWFSFQPGGLAKFANDLIASFPQHFQTQGMKDVGNPNKGGLFALEQCLIVWRGDREARCDEDCITMMHEGAPPSAVDSLNYCDWLKFFIGPDISPKDAQGQSLQARALRAGLARFNFAFLRERCLKHAQRMLPQYLRDLCERPDVGFEKPPSWAAGIAPALFAFMEQHAAKERQHLAMTEVATQLFDALDYAWAAKKFVRVSGSPRFGKSESLLTYCAMYPGRWRLLTVPCSNLESDLVGAVAEPLGIPLGFGARKPELRAKVDFILRHGRIGIVADECHFLFPVRYSRDSAPARLNWFRTKIVDRDLPCALISTPQAYDGQRKRFDRATGYNLDQWTGRMALTVALPETLSREDLLAVARIHFPEVATLLLEDIADAAILATSYTKAVEDIAARARWLASKRGPGAVVAQADVDTAIREVTPEAAAELLGDPASAKRASTGLAARPQRIRKPAAELLRELCPGGRRAKISDSELPQGGRIAEAIRPANLVPA